MGRVVDFAQLPARPAGEGISKATIASGETGEFAADLVRIAPGRVWSSRVPAGSDAYVFLLRGAGTIDAASYRRPLAQYSFATIGEGVGFSIQAAHEAIEALCVVAPPSGSARQVAGFTAALAVADWHAEPVVAVPEQKKTRVYFAGHAHGALTDRGHAMIVGYEPGTLTALHHHPNADSMFLMLEGACRFQVNGEEVDVGPGQATHFPANDLHGLTTAPGHQRASFLEFHIPARFTTVKA